MAGLSSSASASIAHYTRRAEGYDEGSGGFHVGLGRDFVTWLSPARGSVCLDLACGTGLVAIPLAEAIGPEGKVIGVDITKAMLEEARAKTPTGRPPNGGASISCYEGDIMDLSAIEEISDVVGSKQQQYQQGGQGGGFDIISCCSALVLLSDPAAAIKTWARLLKPGGGRLIVDTPTEDKTLLHLFTQELRSAAKLPDEFNWQWIQGKDSLEHLFTAAGLEIEQTIVTKSTEEKVYAKDEVDAVFDEQLTRYTDFMKVSNVEELRRIFRQHWTQNLGEDGTYKDAAKLYVTLGRKP